MVFTIIFTYNLQHSHFQFATLFSTNLKNVWNISLDFQSDGFTQLPTAFERTDYETLSSLQVSSENYEQLSFGFVTKLTVERNIVGNFSSKKQLKQAK